MEKDQALAKECYKLDTNSIANLEEFTGKAALPGCGPSRQVREMWNRRDGPQYVLQIGTKPWDRFAALVAALRRAALKVWKDKDVRDPKACH